MNTYSEKFLNNSKLLNTAVIGIEFEFYMKDLSFYKTLEILNQYLNPVKVFGFREYHPNFKPDDKEFCLTPDLSMGSSGCEIITGPLEYNMAKYYLIKLCKFIQEYGYTNDKCSIHFNISFNDQNLNSLNVLKLILDIDEDEIYLNYPNRKNNVYAKSIKKIIPYKDYDFSNIPIETIKNNLRFPDDKYYGVNFLHTIEEKISQRLEYRYIGGKDYQNNVGNLLYFMDRFIILSKNSLNSEFDDEDIKKMEIYLNTNINNFKNFSTYDSFIINFPTVSLQIDQNSEYNVVAAYYTKIYTYIYTIIDSTEKLEKCILNYETGSQKLEIIDAKITSTFNITGYNFINCTINGGIFNDCEYFNCDILDSQISNSIFNQSRINGSKLINCNIETSQVKDSFCMNGYLNCDIEGGVLRSGNLGPNSYVSSETKIVTNNGNFFDTKFGTDNDKSKKSLLFGFKK